MAKVAFSKIKIKVDDSTKIISIVPDVEIEIKQYLPIQEKLGLIGRVVELAHDQDYNFSNPVKCDVFRDLEVVFAYTNITFTDKQKEDLPKLYDMLKSSGILDTIIKAIPEEEYWGLVNGINNSIESIYKYQNSVVGLLDTLKTDYSDLEFDIEDLTEKLKNSENIDLVKGLLTKLN